MKEAGTLSGWRTSTRKALTAAPDRFPLYSRLASEARRGHQPGIADRALAWARILRPDEPRLHVNAATLWISTKQRGDPVAALRRALCLDPALTTASERLALIEKASGNLRASVRAAEWRLCQHRRGAWAVRVDAAMLHQDLGNLERAMRLLVGAIPEACRVPGALRQVLGRAAGVAIDALPLRLARIALCLAPRAIEAANALALRASGVEAGTAHHPMVSRLHLISPGDTEIWNSIGVVHERGGDRCAARRAYRRSAILDPALSVSLFNVGVLDRYAGDFSAAAVWFRRALARRPSDPIYSYNLGHVLLATDGWREGLARYEQRWASGERSSHRKAGPEPSFPQPFWDGRARPRGEDAILVWGEQGIGDEIWFAGYVPGALSGRRSVLECDQRLVPLFERSALANVVTGRADPPSIQALDAGWQIAAGSLPNLVHAIQNQAVQPAPYGYLKADHRKSAALRDRLERLGSGPIIGVSWRSRKPSTAHSFEAPLAAWGPIFDLPGATFVNLQYDTAAEDLRTVESLHGVTLEILEDIDPKMDIDGLAALLMALDHVVSIANVTVALCHGLGRSCHVALRHYQEDWRFQRDRSATPWLPACSLFWPERPGDWDGVFRRIAENLRIDRAKG